MTVITLMKLISCNNKALIVSHPKKVEINKEYINLDYIKWIGQWKFGGINKTGSSSIIKVKKANKTYYFFKG